MRIVRAMKQTLSRTIRIACTAAAVFAAAPLLAQAPNQAATPPNQAGSSSGTPAAGAAMRARPPAPAPITDEQASYLFGLTFGEQLHVIGVSGQVAPDAVMRGVKEALQGKQSTPAERQQIQEYVKVSMQAAAERNKTAASEFLAKNGSKKGVQTTASGLQYKVMKPGDGKAPPITAADEVTVNYRGKLIDGTEFDSSYSRGVPANFQVGGVIKGWQEALLLMKPGASYELYVPPELAYGSQPRPSIPANSLLIFDVDLVSVKPKADPATAPAPAPATPSKPQ
jgi:FKBP-type peptidyl-prolyl cis-trans isomerase FklB